MRHFTEFEASISVHPAITATGNSQDTAYALPPAGGLLASVSAVDGASGGVMLHPQTKLQVVSNNTAGTLAVWPPPGFAIGGGATDAAYSLALRSANLFYLRDGVTFETVRLGAVS
jgi:hypothetical protein